MKHLCRNFLLILIGFKRINYVCLLCVCQHQQFDQIQESIRRRRQPLRWLSIEALKTLKFTMTSDVWALGVTYWEMFTLANDVPYGEEVPECDDMRQALITIRESGGSLSQPEHASSEL
ncbi:unnamed protein product [Orchesella dallaii]|uniref:Serine-threonine/tyrosine-protein kinase catalytic domain-containing protein n=1 Tax=Orchesella dallaii TaxID=48710 RepID=A0ABP1RK76_9HEXA